MTCVKQLRLEIEEETGLKNASRNGADGVGQQEQHDSIRPRPGGSRKHLLSHNFHDQPLISLAVEFGIENPLPGTKIQFAIGEGDDDFMMN